MFNILIGGIYMPYKMLKYTGFGLLSMGLVFSPGGISVGAHSPGMKVENSDQVEEEARVRNFDKLENKINAINSKIDYIEVSLEKPPLSAEEVKKYEEYKEEIQSLLNRLKAVENHLKAITKNHAKTNEPTQEIEGLIKEVRINGVEIVETIERYLAETMSSSGEVPDGLEVAESPAFEIDTQAIIEADHMPGMKGAEATVVGAYDTTAYSVTYYPTTGGDPVKDHKWVIHEELENPGEEPLKPGTVVTLNADHMEGMDGATAVIESAVETNVYMLDFTTTTGENVVNHKWIVESELSPVE